MSDEARTWLANHGYDPEYGARPLRRLIQNQIEDVLSDGILSGKFTLANVVRARANEDDELVLEQVQEDELETPTA